jgi:hypothetical protein
MLASTPFRFPASKLRRVRNRSSIAHAGKKPGTFTRLLLLWRVLTFLIPAPMEQVVFRDRRTRRLCVPFRMITILYYD